MPAAEKDISPEEKLLKVIQDPSEADKETPSPEERLLAAAKNGDDKPDVSEGAKPEAVPATATEAKPPPKLKLAKSKKSPDPSEKLEGKRDEKSDEVPKIAIAEPSHDKPPAVGLIGPGPAPVVKRGGGQWLGLAAVNNAIAALAVAMLFLSGWEIWGAIRLEEAEHRPSTYGHDGQNEFTNPVGPRTFESLIKWRNILRPPDAPAATGASPDDSAPEPDRAPPRPAPQGWQKYVKEHFNIGGYWGKAEDRTVMMLDDRTGEQFFLKAGESISVSVPNSGGSTKLRLDKIDSNRAYISDGRITVEVIPEK